MHVPSYTAWKKGLPFNPVMNVLIRRVAVCTAVLAILLGCSNNPPEILQSYWQLNLSPSETDGSGTGGYVEELSLFILPHDEDGADELEYIYLISDDSELFWEIGSGEWETVDMDSESWLGVSRLMLPAGESFTGRQLRIVLVDKSGQRTERSISIAVNPVNRIPVFPELSRSGDRVVLRSPQEQNLFRIYDTEGFLLGEFKTKSRNFSLDQILSQADKPDNADSLIVFTMIPEGGYILKSRAISLQREKQPEEKLP